MKCHYVDAGWTVLNRHFKIILACSKFVKKEKCLPSLKAYKKLKVSAISGSISEITIVAFYQSKNIFQVSGVVESDTILNKK